MYDICHPSYYEIGQLGSRDELKITTAFYVYIELCEVARLWDVVYKYKPTIDMIYLTAKASQKAETQIYVPWSMRNNIKLSDIEKIQKELDCPRFILVLKSGESSSMFYTVGEGLMKPLEPEVSKKVRSANEKKWALNNELKKNSRNLYDLAKVKEDVQGATTSS